MCSLDIDYPFLCYFYFVVTLCSHYYLFVQMRPPLPLSVGVQWSTREYSLAALLLMFPFILYCIYRTLLYHTLLLKPGRSQEEEKHKGKERGRDINCNSRRDRRGGWGVGVRKQKWGWKGGCSPAVDQNGRLCCCFSTQPCPADDKPPETDKGGSRWNAEVRPGHEMVLDYLPWLATLKWIKNMSSFKRIICICGSA